MNPRSNQQRPANPTQRLCSTIVQCWGTKPSLRISGYLWVAAMFGLLAILEANQIGVFLVPPFAATLTILVSLPDAPVAQPYALITGSVCGAAVGTGASCIGRGIGMAVLAMIAAFVVISLIHAYHPPGVALASIPVLLHPGHWFLCSSCFLSPPWPSRRRRH